MTEGEAIAGLLGALLPALDGLEHAARHVAPDTLARLAEAHAAPAAALAEALDAFRLFPWPERLAPVHDCLAQAAAAALGALADLREAPADDVPMRAAYRALRGRAAAQAALYPLAAFLPVVSRHFLDPDSRADAALAARLAAVPPGREGTGVMHLGGPSGTRGGFSLYVPETFEPAHPAPLVVALHGGSGDGGAFLWTWLRAARARGAIVLAPTSAGPSWSLRAPEGDLAAIAAMVEDVAARWPVAAGCRLLTGMSDGGTLATLAALRGAAGFTHLAPVAGTFNPLLMAFADPAALRGLPIRLVHGTRDWMFPVATAREAARMLADAGAAVTFREIADLPHAWPGEETAAILDWARGARG